MQPTEKETPSDLEWTRELGLTSDEILALNPAVPGEFTMADAYYLNTGSPYVVYVGTMEGTLPLVAGRWYLVPGDIVARHAELTRETAPVSRAARLVG